jgi:dihydroorotate dehydrogenase electron transfer subunit
MIDALRSQYQTTVSANIPLCREHYRLTLNLPEFPCTKPGHFIQIACRDLRVDDSVESEVDWSPSQVPNISGRELHSPLAVLRRPFSLAGRSDSDSGVSLDIIHRVVGVGTDWMAHLRQGDAVQIIGPLGNHFDLPDADRPAILVGGGVGIPPMLYLAQALAGRSAVAFCGVTTKDLLPLQLIGPATVGNPSLCVGEFAAHGIPAVISTDDGSLGFHGYVTAALESHLDEAMVVRRPIVYTCGPEIMMKRVAEIAIRRGLECQVAVERAMACGMGTCQSCVIRVKATGRADGRDWVYRLACTDGPIFRAAELLW